MFKFVEKEIVVFNIMEIDGSWVCYVYVVLFIFFVLKYCIFFCIVYWSKVKFNWGKVILC